MKYSLKIDVEKTLPIFAKKIKDTSALMEDIGNLGVAASQNAFIEQKFGDTVWPPRYPNQSEPKLNIAGFVSDLAAGRDKPKPNRFKDRPALIDEGMRGGLMGSISWRLLTSTSVEWGTTKPYASVQNFGGVTEIPITPEVKSKMSTWLKKKKNKPYRSKVGPLFRKTVLTTNVGARPFIGITPELESDIGKLVIEYFQKGT